MNASTHRPHNTHHTTDRPTDRPMDGWTRRVRYRCQGASKCQTRNTTYTERRDGKAPTRTLSNYLSISVHDGWMSGWMDGCCERKATASLFATAIRLLPDGLQNSTSVRTSPCLSPLDRHPTTQHRTHHKRESPCWLPFSLCLSLCLSVYGNACCHVLPLLPSDLRPLFRLSEKDGPAARFISARTLTPTSPSPDSRRWYRSHERCKNTSPSRSM
mmetsp:Transcript_34905/g.86656  ORF Transcript_34905/g.86656 Transcript_34905/m.86656 type:complete len:215 (-) Transcript_34905:1327-1971(-)